MLPVMRAPMQRPVVPSSITARQGACIPVCTSVSVAALSTPTTRSPTQRKIAVRASQADVKAGAPTPPPLPKVEVDVQTVTLDGTTRVIQCFCKASINLRPEYGLKRGSTTNSYLIEDGDDSVLVDLPRGEYSEVFVSALGENIKNVHTILLTHVTPEILKTLGELLTAMKEASNKKITLVVSKPAVKVLQTIGTNADGVSLLDDVAIEIPVNEETFKVGRRSVKVIYVSTPRYPDMLCVYERTTRRLFSSCLFSAHVNPVGAKGSGISGTDRGGWAAYGSDWQHFFDCMLAPTAKQVAGTLQKLNISVASGGSSGGFPPLLLQIMDLFKVKPADTPPSFNTDNSNPVAQILPRHGPIVSQAVTQLITSYNSWVAEQVANAENAQVAVLYASAYGNTATLAQAISRGITKAGVGVEMVNLEQVTLKESEAILEKSQGFVIGSPTLAGHMPTQVSAALGSILRSSAAKALPCGAYGSYGWSGEAVDILNGRLADAGFAMAFKPIKAQFRPDEKVLQVCQESGTDLAQKVLLMKKRASKDTASRASQSAMTSASGAQQAMGRVVGSLSIVTTKDGEAESAMLASWLSQASFDPPGITVAVKKDRAVETFLVNGSTFNVNILSEGKERPVIKALLRPFEPGQDRFEGMEGITRSEATGCAVLQEAVSLLECRVTDRMDAGDHWLVYGTVVDGELKDKDSVSAVHHRKSGANY